MRYCIELHHWLDQGDRPILYESDDFNSAKINYTKHWYRYASIDGYTVVLRDREKLTLICCNPNELNLS